MSLLGLWTLILGVGFLIATLPLQFLINFLVSLDVPGGMLGATLVWILWIVWLVAAIVLFIIWLVKRLRSSKSA